ncbi:BON domain-containing protein [Geomonas sp. RF6]|uniref:BON domain-containing protein n=1 Tax=Geomonas sp. RF6 TaxID=2897342 RepID=UPI001E298C15|nr:BON domain-containing protein [Geomonas sp. RF6]UFS71476.1 BON domain-containing protein [Geomonas sp. RF6]
MNRKLAVAFALSAVVAVSAPITGFAQSDTGTEPDNTRVNKEMRQKGTADQQKENPADRKMTQQIRKAITKNKSLSTKAHNVKIITRGGQVSLRGPVKSEEEKQIVEQAATQVAGEGKVTNELTVAPEKK